MAESRLRTALLYSAFRLIKGFIAFRPEEKPVALPEQRAPDTLHFLDLPLEIRMMIYDLLLVDTVGLTLEPRLNSRQHVIARPQKSKPKRFYPHILRTNRQVCQESSAALYGRNIFRFPDTTALYFFLLHIGKGRAHIRDIYIEAWKGNRVWADHPAFAMLCDAVNLRCLRLPFPRCDIERRAEGFYRNAYHWFEAVGSRTGNKAAALDLLWLGPTVLPTTFGPFPVGEREWEPAEAFALFCRELEQYLK